MNAKMRDRDQVTRGGRGGVDLFSTIDIYVQYHRYEMELDAWKDLMVQIIEGW